MSKAAIREELQNDDFVVASNFVHRPSGLHVAPVHLPSAIGENGSAYPVDEEDETDEPHTRVQPLNVRVLKDYMYRKQKGLFSQSRTAKSAGAAGAGASTSTPGSGAGTSGAGVAPLQLEAIRE